MFKDKLLYVLLVIVLIINFMLFEKVGDLNNRIQNLSHSYNSLQSSLNSVSSNVNQTLNKFTREQSWITPIQTNYDKTKVEDKLGFLVLNWQIKDFQEGSIVNFHYRQPDSEEFKIIESESVTTGLFEVSLPLELNSEPIWEVEVSRSGETGIAEQVIHEKISPEQSLQYYVSMKTKDFVKSSEISHLNYGYLSSMKYEPVRGHIIITRNDYIFSIFGDNMANNGLESVTVKFYSGSNLITEKPITAEEDPHGMKHYHLNYDLDSQDISRFILEVKYENGESFSKEIYS